MTKARPTILLLLAVTVLLSACARPDRGMMNLRADGRGPDEFAILPTKPLQEPKDYAQLPPPTPGASNLADPTPRQDAVAALGGNPKYLVTDGLPRSDQGLVQAATRYGVASDIRTVLADEDAEFRSKNRGRLLERLFGTTVYFSAYEPQELDRYSELKRLRRAGIRTPAAPPQAAQ
jgi:DUF3035 family protein